MFLKQNLNIQPYPSLSMEFNIMLNLKCRSRWKLTDVLRPKQSKSLNLHPKPQKRSRELRFAKRIKTSRRRWTYQESCSKFKTSCILFHKTTSWNTSMDSSCGRIAISIQVTPHSLITPSRKKLKPRILKLSRLWAKTLKWYLMTDRTRLGLSKRDGFFRLETASKHSIKPLKFLVLPLN